MSNNLTAWRNRGKTLFRILFVLGCLYFLSKQVSWSAVSTTLSDLTVVGILVALLIESLSHFIEATRHWVWLRNISPTPKWSTFLKARYISVFAGNFLPSSLVSDGLKAAYLSRETNLPSSAWASTVMVRIIGLLVTCLFLVIGISFKVAPTEIKGGTALLITMVCALCGFFFIFNETVIRLFMNLIRRSGVPFLQKLEPFFFALSAYRTRYSEIAISFGLSILYQLSTVVSVWWICHATNTSVDFWLLFFNVPLISFIVMIPASVNGIGLQDVSWIYLMSNTSISNNTLAAISIAWHLTRIGGSIPGLWVFLKLKTKPVSESSTPINHQ